MEAKNKCFLLYYLAHFTNGDGLGALLIRWFRFVRERARARARLPRVSVTTQHTTSFLPINGDERRSKKERKVLSFFTLFRRRRSFIYLCSLSLCLSSIRTPMNPLLAPATVSDAALHRMWVDEHMVKRAVSPTLAYGTHEPPEHQENP